MSDIKNFLDIVEEYSEEDGLVEAQDSFDIELGEDLIIETGVIDVNEDGILVEGDQETLRLLAEHGLILEETDWSKYDEPTVDRIKKGVTKPVDRTDYDTPPAMRDKTLGMTGPEKRRASLIAQGILKVGLKKEEAEQMDEVNRNKTKTDDHGGRYLAGLELDRKIKELEKEIDKMSPNDGGGRYLAGLKLDKMKAMKEEAKQVDEAKYQGREVPLGKPMQGDVKKSKVYVKGPKGNVVKVNFGDKKMRIKKSNPGRRKNFRARHNCKNPGPRWKARYWSCRAW
jgi:hypothetical protein